MISQSTIRNDNLFMSQDYALDKKLLVNLAILNQVVNKWNEKLSLMTVFV